MNRNKVNSGKLKDLIKGCIRNDRKAQALLFQTYASKMYALCLYYAKNKIDAEDYLHNGFIKVFENIKQYKEKGSFEGWMRRIFINSILENFRRMRVAPVDYIEIEAEERFDIEDSINTEEMIRAVQKLSPAYRMVFNLYAIEGYTHKEIGEILQISEGTSKSNLARARNILQKKLKLHFQIEK